MWDSTTSKLTLKQNYKGCHRLVKDLSITRDNNFLIKANTTRDLNVWNTNMGKICQTLKGHQDEVSCVDACMNSSHIASSDGNTIKL